MSNTGLFRVISDPDVSLKPMRFRDSIIQQIINHLKASIHELEDTLQSEKASLYGETKSSAGDKYETQREMIQGEIQRTKTQWSLKNEQLESLYSIVAWEQTALEKFTSPNSQNPNPGNPFQFIRNGSVVQLIPTTSINISKSAQNESPHSANPNADLQNAHPPIQNDKTLIKTDGMWLFIGVSLGDLKIKLSSQNFDKILDSHNNMESKKEIALTFKTLTTESPLGKILLGKQSGDSLQLNDKSFSILNCF